MDEANAWIKQSGLSSPLELVIEFAPDVKGTARVKLFEGDKEGTVIAVDRERGLISVDRTRSGNSSFHSKFPRVVSAPYTKADGSVKLHILVDACSVEVFANDGAQALTSLIFPSKTARAMELFEPGGRIATITAWRLTAIW